MKKYIVRAVRYEGSQIFGIKDMAECVSKEDAEEIVVALESSSNSVLFHYGVIEIDREHTTNGNNLKIDEI